jgi:acyl-CoA thioester hydrolase
MAAGLPNNAPTHRKVGAEKTEPPRREDYKHFLSIPTRWMDNDVYGHVNNVVYYAYFDTVVNEYLIAEGGLDIENSPVIGLVVETLCRYFQPITFPEVVEAGLRVGKLGNSSVRYEIGIFRRDDPAPAAAGHFVHVYVDRGTRRPVPVPDGMRQALARILAAS